MPDIVSGHNPVKIRRLKRGKIVLRDDQGAEKVQPVIVPGLSIESLKREEVFNKATFIELLVARVEDKTQIEAFKKAADKALAAGEIPGAELKGIRWAIPCNAAYAYLDKVLPQGGAG